MADLIWIFREPSAAHIAALDNFTVKTDLRSLRTRLETLPAARVSVHYPRPWNLDAFGPDVLGEWIEFHLDVLTLRAEFGDRIVLRPLPFEPLVDQVAPESILTWLMELSSPDACSVLEALEMVAHLEGRAPWIRGRHLRLSPDLATQLRHFIDQAGLYQVEVARAAELQRMLDAFGVSAAQKLADLQNSHASALDALDKSHRQQVEQLHVAHQDTVREMQQRFDAELQQTQARESEWMNEQSLLLAQLHDVQERLMAECAQRASLQQSTDDQHAQLNASIDMRSMLSQEVAALTEQLHEVQAALQRKYAEVDHLRDELRLAGNTMQWASRLLLSKMRSAG